MKARERSKAHEYLFVAVVVAAVIVRVALAAVNLYANDNHPEVVALMLANGATPRASDCHQCYHPKLYYWTGALLLDALGFRDIRSSSGAIHLLQGLNVLAGLGTLCLAWLYLKSSSMREGTRVWVFSLIALNPALVLINCQASNDSFAIFFSAMAIWACRRVCLSRSAADLALLVAAASLANLSKGSALPVTAAIAIVIGAWGLGRRKVDGEPVRSLAIAGLYACIVGTLTLTLGPYGRLAGQHGGSAMAFNYGLPAPNEGKIFYLGERPMRAGEALRLALDHFATLRIISLLERPYNVRDTESPPEHMGSLWTQIYGRANSARFNNWPPEYISTGPASLGIRRLIFVLALLPLTLAMYGLWHAASRLATRGLSTLETFTTWPDLLVVLVSMASVIYFSLSFVWPGSSFVKAIYIYPAMPCYARLLGRGADRFRAMSRRHPDWKLAAELALGVLLLLYVSDVCSLIWDLASRSASR